VLGDQKLFQVQATTHVVAGMQIPLHLRISTVWFILWQQTMKN